MNQAYKKQVALLLSVIPEVAKEECFALHGGTAINLFVREMPRLSVDIDLTYLLIEDRATSLAHISDALKRIRENIIKVLPQARVLHLENMSKLQISSVTAQIKIEVNQTNRGALHETIPLQLCEKAQEEFDVFCAIQGVSLAQLYGGKICAALDRQHPRDLFDVKYILEQGGLSEDLGPGVIMCLLGSPRPIHELLQPHLLDQRAAFENQFDGMTAHPFTYEEYESTRLELVQKLRESLGDSDKKFLLSFVALEPDWSIHDLQAFPSVQWKLKNLQSLKQKNPSKYEEQINILKAILEGA